MFIPNLPLIQLLEFLWSVSTYNKEIIYLRDKSIQDGGSVYWNREPKTPNIER